MRQRESTERGSEMKTERQRERQRDSGRATARQKDKDGQERRIEEGEYHIYTERQPETIERQTETERHGQT